MPANPPDDSVRPVAHERTPLHIVLVADGSPDTVAGAKTIQALSLRPGSQITVVTKSGSGAGPGGQLTEAVLQQATSLVQRDGLTVMSRAIPEISARHLREYTTAPRADLVVDGTEVPPPTLAGKLRDTLNPLVEQLAVPILVARAPFKGLRRILLPYDGSPDSDAAVDYLTRLPLPADTAVTVLMVLTDIPTIEAVSAGGPEIPRRAREASVLVVRDKPHAQQLHLAKTQVDRAVKVLAGAGLEARGRVLWGDAAAAILHKAAATDADLLVAGSRGLSGAWSWLLGSVSRRLVRDRRWPVLIVRGQVPGGAQ